MASSANLTSSQELGIGALAGLGGLGAFAQARARNRSISDSLASDERDAQIQADNARTRADLEERKILANSRARRSLLRVAAAERGSASIERIIRDEEESLALDRAINQENFRLSIQGIASGLRARALALSSQRTSSISAAASGSLSAALAGLQIASFEESLRRRDQAEQELP